MESECIFHVESENEDEDKNFGDKNEDKDFYGDEEEDDLENCNSSDHEDDDKRNSFDPSWQKSYR